MSLFRFANNASTTLAAGITTTALALTVASGTGTLFPTTTGAQHFRATLVKNGSPGVFEIIDCTRSGDTFTIARAQEGTTALAWASGDFVSLFPTAGDLQAFAQLDDLQTQAGNYAADAGSGANIYSVTLSPALAAPVVGLPIRFLALHSSTGASTFNPGPGALNLVTADGAALAPGSIVAGGLYEAMYDGSQYRLITVHQAAFSQITGSIANGQVPQSAVQQYQAALTIAFGQLSGSIANGQVPLSAVQQYQGSLSIAWGQLVGTKNADQLQGATASQVANAGTIAERDSSGNLAANRLVQAAPQNESITIGDIFVTQSGDPSGQAHLVALSALATALASAQSLNTPGCVQFNGGFTLMWGSLTKQASAQGVAVAFPTIPGRGTPGFPAACFGVSLQETGGLFAAPTAWIQSISPGSINAGGFQINADDFGPGPNPTLTVYWFAWGH